jgi:hypothetical protein
MSLDVAALVRSLSTEARNRFINAIVAGASAEELAAIGVGMVRRLDALAKVDALGAGRVAAAIMRTFAGYRPEPTPLDADFLPTEPIPSGPRGG